MKPGQPVIIQCAVTGSQPVTGRNPNLPATSDAIARSAIEAARAGASVLHIHARDENGLPTGDPDAFRAIVEQIRSEEPDVILNLSTGSGGGLISGADRWACVELRPEMASFDCGSVNMGDRVFENPRPFLRDLAQALNDQGVRPEVECFEVGHIEQALALRDEGLLSDPLCVQFVLGVPGAAAPTLANLAYFHSLLPTDATWSVCGVGAAQLPLTLIALGAGGHVRTGLEDSLYFSRGVLADSNAQLVERVVRLANEVGRPIADPDQAREILSVPVGVG